jgi:hypothetical protein
VTLPLSRGKLENECGKKLYEEMYNGQERLELKVKG